MEFGENPGVAAGRAVVGFSGTMTSGSGPVNYKRDPRCELANLGVLVIICEPACASRGRFGTHLRHAFSFICEYMRIARQRTLEEVPDKDLGINP